MSVGAILARPLQKPSLRGDIKVFLPFLPFFSGLASRKSYIVRVFGELSSGIRIFAFYFLIRHSLYKAIVNLIKSFVYHARKPLSAAKGCAVCCARTYSPA